MLSWQWPYALFLLPLPFIIRFFLQSHDAAAGAIKVPFYSALESLNVSSVNSNSSRFIRAALLWLVWSSLVIALARPTWVGDPINLPQDRRDLMLAVDISGSMQEQDMLVQNQYIDRISAVKEVVGEFVEKRAGDRMGLILFGAQGYLQTPLTHDRQTVKRQLQEAQLGFAGDGTAIGDAIGLAIKRLRGRPADSRILILLTDGANTSGTEPLQAADIAAEAEIKIHTIGVGADEKLERSIFGTRRVNPSVDLDEVTLKAIADKTGGQYFRARNPQELNAIYTLLDQLEPIPEEQTFRPTRSLLHWPLGLGLLLNLLLMTIIRRLA